MICTAPMPGRLPVYLKSIHGPRTLGISGCRRISSLGWASMYPAAKLALVEVEPLHIVWARAAVAGLALALLTIVSKRGLRSGLAQLRAEGRTRPWGWLLLGLMNFVGTSLLVLSAQRFLAASVNGLLNNTSPLWLALAAALLGRAVHPSRLLTGSLIALVGVGLVVIGADTAASSGPWWQAFATADLRGVGLSLAGSVLIAIATIVARRVMPGRDAVAATSLACLWAALVLTPLVFAFAGGSRALGQRLPRHTAPALTHGVVQYGVQLQPLVLRTQRPPGDAGRPSPIPHRAVGRGTERHLPARAADVDPHGRGDGHFGRHHHCPARREPVPAAIAQERRK